MAVLAADRNTLAKYEGVLNTFKIKAATKIFAGALVATNAGYLVPAADTAGLKVQGRADDKGDNSAGADGAVEVRVQQGVFLWDNSGADAVVAADMGKIVYAEDDHTVKHTAGNGVVAGIALQIDAGGGIWVQTTLSGGI